MYVSLVFLQLIYLQSCSVVKVFPGHSRKKFECEVFRPYCISVKCQMHVHCGASLYPPLSHCPPPPKKKTLAQSPTLGSSCFIGICMKVTCIKQPPPPSNINTACQNAEICSRDRLCPRRIDCAFDRKNGPPLFSGQNLANADRHLYGVLWHW